MKILNQHNQQYAPYQRNQFSNFEGVKRSGKMHDVPFSRLQLERQFRETRFMFNPGQRVPWQNNPYQHVSQQLPVWYPPVSTNQQPFFGHSPAGPPIANNPATFTNMYPRRNAPGVASMAPARSPWKAKRKKNKPSQSPKATVHPPLVTITYGKFAGRKIRPAEEPTDTRWDMPIDSIQQQQQQQQQLPAQLPGPGLRTRGQHRKQPSHNSSLELF